MVGSIRVRPSIWPTHLITSHMAGNYASYMSEFWRLPVETEIDLSQGRWPLSRVNPDVVLQWNFSER